MKTKDLLRIVYNYFPEEIVDDTVFNGLWSDVLGECKDSAFLTGTVGLRQDIYDRVIEEHPDLKKFLSVCSKDKIVNFMFVVGKAIKFIIHDSDFFLDLSIQEFDYHAEASTIYVRNYGSVGRIEIERTLMDKDGYYADYTCDVKYIDEFGEPLDVEGVEEEKDVIFSGKFCIPESMARVFRLNFKKYSKEITRMKAKSEMISYDNVMSDEDKFLFSKPFLLKDLRDVIINDAQSRTITELQELGVDTDGENYTVQKPDAINGIVDALVSQIGKEALVVISDNIVQNFYFVLEDVVSNEILTKGMIIKKENGTFTLYALEIENNMISVIPQVLDEKAREILFDKSSKNSNVEGLREFLELSLKR